MTFVIVQLSDPHIGGPVPGNRERLVEAITKINEMSRQPDLVLLTGDLTHSGSPAEWAEVKRCLALLDSRWEAVPGNHDQSIDDIAGHRSLLVGPIHLILVDSSKEIFTPDDQRWLDYELSRRPRDPTIVAIHHPPFETGIWWMDCVGLDGAGLFEGVVRRHGQVIKVLSGHMHRLIQTNWGSCSLWASPATSVSYALDLDPVHIPAETAEPPMLSLHAYTGQGIVSYLVPIGAEAIRSELETRAPEYFGWLRSRQAGRSSIFSDPLNCLDPEHRDPI